MRSNYIVWLPEAVADLNDILDFIAEQNVLAALGVDAQIKRQIDQLINFPLLGRKGRILGSYELVISRTPYLAAYRLQEKQIQILHIFHERRSWPPETTPKFEA